MDVELATTVLLPETDNVARSRLFVLPILDWMILDIIFLVVMTARYFWKYGWNGVAYEKIETPVEPEVNLTQTPEEMEANLIQRNTMWTLFQWGIRFGNYEAFDPLTKEGH